MIREPVSQQPTPQPPAQPIPTGPTPGPAPEVAPEVAASSRRPILLVLAGVACLSFSPTLVALTHATPATSALLRCALALLVLAPLAGWECLGRGRPSTRPVCWALAAGGCLGVDYLLYTVSVFSVGAGIATVLINVQVVAFPVLGRIFDGTGVPRRFILASPIMLAGIALVSGLGDGLVGRLLAHGGAPTGDVNGGLGSSGATLPGAAAGVAAGLAYTGYLYLSRRGARLGDPHVITPVCLATTAAAGVAGLFGGLSGGLRLALPASTWAWASGMAMVGQVVPWLLVGAGAKRLAPHVTAALLAGQSLLALLVSLLVLHERPSAAQLVGCAVVITSVWYATRR